MARRLNNNGQTIEAIFPKKISKVFFGGISNGTQRGITLVETVVYAAILALITVGALRLLLSSSFNVAEVRAERKIIANGKFALELLTREIRLSSDVISAGSTFGTNPGTLQLRSLASPGSGAEATKTFGLSASRITRQIEGGGIEYLTGADTRVIDLTFWQSANNNSKLISIKLTLEAGKGRAEERATFYGSAVLRRGY